MEDVRRSVAVLAARFRDAHVAPVCLPLQHRSWESYCRAEFGISRPRRTGSSTSPVRSPRSTTSPPALACPARETPTRALRPRSTTACPSEPCSTLRPFRRRRGADFTRRDHVAVCTGLGDCSHRRTGRPGRAAYGHAERQHAVRRGRAATLEVGVSSALVSTTFSTARASSAPSIASATTSRPVEPSAAQSWAATSAIGPVPHHLGGRGGHWPATRA